MHYEMCKLSTKLHERETENREVSMRALSVVSLVRLQLTASLERERRALDNERRAKEDAMAR